jgi:ABC-type transporter Mla maintaining outer membrane lipid asymmetry ATPase subunit MlaF
LRADASRESGAIVRVRGLHYAAGGRVIVAGVVLVFPRGAVTAVMGRCGSGKTSLLRLVTGQVRPDRGLVVVATLSKLRYRKERDQICFHLLVGVGVVLEGNGQVAAVPIAVDSEVMTNLVPEGALEVALGSQVVGE